jgi:two-component system response regulator (stage 0 sporulation protein F)
MSRILVVDDDTLVLLTIQTLLVNGGFEVVAVDRARKALAALECGQFDAIVVDMFMPEMDGYRAIKEFQRLAPGIPVVAMSGIVFRESSGGRAPDFLGMAAKMGATRALTKPFKRAELLEAIHACVEARGRQFAAHAESKIPELATQQPE